MRYTYKREKPQRTLTVLSAGTDHVKVCVTLGKDQAYELCLEGSVATCGCWANLKTPPCRHEAIVQKLIDLGKL